MQFLVLIFAHLLGDYPLQGDFLAKQKGTRLIAMWSHCGIWTGCVTIAAHFVGLHISLLQVLLLFFVHWLADHVKATECYTDDDPLGWSLWVDQGIHVVQIIALYISCS